MHEILLAPKQLDEDILHRVERGFVVSKHEPATAVDHRPIPSVIGFNINCHVGFLVPIAALTYLLQQPWAYLVLPDCMEIGAKKHLLRRFSSDLADSILAREAPWLANGRTQRLSRSSMISMTARGISRRAIPGVRC
ncbi:MAG: hypothetical protein ACOC0O_05890, partial [Spirochaetota bacterium]